MSDIKAQKVLADFGDFALQSEDLDAVLTEACRLVGEATGTGRAKVLEIEPGGESLFVRAGVGWAPGVVGVVRLPMEEHSSESYAIEAGEPVITQDISKEDRFDVPPFMKEAGVVALVNVPIFLPGKRAYGLLQVDDTVPRGFDQDDIEFLRTYAIILGPVIDRLFKVRDLLGSEERYRALFDSVDQGFCVIEMIYNEQGRPADYRFLEVNAAFERQTGLMDAAGRTIRSLVPEHEEHWFETYGRIDRTRRAERFEAAAEGLGRHYKVYAFPVGRPEEHKLGVLFNDIQERKRAEAALRESEARFRQFGDASGDVLWIRNAETLAFEYVSPAFEEIYGHKLEDILGSNDIRRWAEMILPEDREKALGNMRRVQEGEHLLHAFRILRADGEVRWIRDTDFPLTDEKGRVQRLGGIGHDATEEVELQDRLRVLVAELQHRSRNLLGVVQGVTERTLANSVTLEDFRTRIRARLAALGRVNGLLSRLDEGDRITFDQLLQNEMQAHGVVGVDGQGEQVSFEGPKGIRLRSATVQTFALAVHELATNALKYGALSRPEGRLEVGWGLLSDKGGEQRLRVEWRESGVPVAAYDGAPEDPEAPPRRQGYGRELIERALPYQLKAQTRYELTAEGVRCTIVVPVSSTLDVAFSGQ